MSLASVSKTSRRSLLALCAAVVAWMGIAATGSAALDPAKLSSWTLPEASLYAVTIRGQNAWAAGYWGTIVRSTDGGRTWSRIESPTAKTYFGISFADDKTGWVVGQNGAIARTTDGGLTWAAQTAEISDEMGGTIPLDTSLFSVAAISPTEAWAVGDLGVVLHTRDGEKWEKVGFDAATLADDNVPERLFNAVVFTSPTNGYIAGEFATLLRTTDGGQTWVGQRQIEGAPADLYLFNLSSSPAGTAAATGLAGSVLVSSDGGAIWQSRSVDTSAGLFAIAWDGERGIAVGDRGVVFNSTDGGRTWTDAKRPALFNWLSGVAFGGENLALVVGEGGLILRSDDGGASWVAATKPNPKAESPILQGQGGEGTPADVTPAPGVP